METHAPNDMRQPPRNASPPRLKADGSPMLNLQPPPDFKEFLKFCLEREIYPVVINATA